MSARRPRAGSSWASCAARYSSSGTSRIHDLEQCLRRGSRVSRTTCTNRPSSPKVVNDNFSCRPCCPAASRVSTTILPAAAAAAILGLGTALACVLSGTCIIPPSWWENPCRPLGDTIREQTQARAEGIPDAVIPDGHTKNKEPSNRPKHEKGDTRRRRDRGGREVMLKGAIRESGHTGPWPPKG